MVDTSGCGPGAGNGVQVRVLLLTPHVRMVKWPNTQSCNLCIRRFESYYALQFNIERMAPMKKGLLYDAMKIGIALIFILSTQLATLNHPVLALLGYIYGLYLLDRFHELSIKGSVVK